MIPLALAWTEALRLRMLTRLLCRLRRIEIAG